MCVCVCVRTCVCARVCAHTCVCACICARMCGCVGAYICVCVHMCMCMCVCTYVTNLGVVRGQDHTNNEQTQSVDGII